MKFGWKGYVLSFPFSMLTYRSPHFIQSNLPYGVRALPMLGKANEPVCLSAGSNRWIYSPVLWSCRSLGRRLVSCASPCSRGMHLVVSHQQGTWLDFCSSLQAGRDKKISRHSVPGRGRYNAGIRRAGRADGDTRASS